MSFQLDYVILAAVFTVLHLILKQVWPEFPLSQETFNTLLLAILAKAGIDVVGAPAVNAVKSVYARFFVKKPAVKASAKKSSKK